MTDQDLGKTKIVRLVAPTDCAGVTKCGKEAIGDIYCKMCGVTQSTCKWAQCHGYEGCCLECTHSEKKICSAEKCEICGADITHVQEDG